jgi:hypothetical protein
MGSIIYVCAPKKELTMASANPPLGALHELIGNSSATIWGTKPLGGRAASAHVGWCVFCVVVASCLLATKDTYFVGS